MDGSNKAAASAETRVKPRLNTDSKSTLIIDLHTHFIPRTLPDFSTRYGYSGFVSLQTDGPNPGFGRLMKDNTVVVEVPSCAWDLNERIMHMDEKRIRLQVLSPIPALFGYWAKAYDTADLCRIVNNSISKEIQRFKTTENTVGRFLGLGIVPMQAPELAIIELERCVKELGFVGVQIGTHINEWNLDAPELAPFWEACEELNSCVFVHPWDMEVSRKDRKYWLPNLIGMSHETNRAISTVLLGGILDKFPKLKICFSDGGGSFPYIQSRLQQGYDLNPKKVATECDVPPKKFLGKFFCDTVVGDSGSLELLVNVVGSDRVLFGTNYPFVPGSMPIVDFTSADNMKEITRAILENQSLIDNATNMSDDVKEKILGLNALDFLGIELEKLEEELSELETEELHQEENSEDDNEETEENK